MHMIDVLNETRANHLVTYDITHAYHYALVGTYLLGIHIILLCLDSKVVLALGPVVAASFDRMLLRLLFLFFMLAGLGYGSMQTAREHRRDISLPCAWLPPWLPSHIF